MKVLLLTLLLTLFLLTPAMAYTFDPVFNDTLGAMLEGDYNAVRESCLVLEAASGPQVKAEAVYLQGICLMEQGEFASARNTFKRALFSASSDLATRVYIGIADTYYQQYSYDKAADIYEQLLEKHADSDLLAMLYFKLGKSSQKLSKWAKADECFKQLKEKYPSSLEAGLIKNSDAGGNFFTVQVGCFTNADNARKLCADLKSKDYPAYITELSSKGKTLYRVRVGEYVSLLSAEYTGRRLQEQENLPTHIFP